jgi:hypothetical protein
MRGSSLRTTIVDRHVARMKQYLGTIKGLSRITLPLNPSYARWPNQGYSDA